MTSQLTQNNPYHGISRAERENLTRRLLARAALVPPGPGRESVLDHVVEANICVARSIAARYGRRGVDIEDLEQVACAALVRAVKKFDPAQDKDLLAYAVPSIRGEIRRYFRDHGWMVRPPRRVQELQSAVANQREALRATTVAPTEEQIAASLDVPVDDVHEALRAEGCFRPTSLDAPLGTDRGTTFGDNLVDDTDEQAAADARVMVLPLLRRLTARDRALIRMRFYQDMTQQQIADGLGVTQAQISRRLSRILGELRRCLSGDASSHAGGLPAAS